MATLGLKQEEDPLAAQTTQTAWPVTNLHGVYLDGYMTLAIIEEMTASLY